MREVDVNEKGESESGAQQNGQNGQSAPSGTVKAQMDIEAVRALPVVVIKNFATKHGRDDILAVVARWAASVVESQVSVALWLSGTERLLMGVMDLDGTCSCA